MTQRERMLDAVVAAVAEKGYADTTVADVVARAGVSRRTFYEQFDDKLDCFLEAYVAYVEALMAELEAAVQATPPGERLRVGLRVYLEHLAARPRFARVLVVDILGAGPRALEVREEMRVRFAERWRGVSDNDNVLRALVGGIAELVQARLLEGDAESLPDLAPTLEEFVRRIAGDRGEVSAEA